MKTHQYIATYTATDGLDAFLAETTAERMAERLVPKVREANMAS